eukprot:9077658-Pyramimonas_sp.AAC.1
MHYYDSIVDRAGSNRCVHCLQVQHRPPPTPGQNGAMLTENEIVHMNLAGAILKSGGHREHRTSSHPVPGSRRLPGGQQGEPSGAFVLCALFRRESGENAAYQ